MDNYYRHVRPVTFQMLADYQVKIITFSLYINHIFQSFDLTLFDNFKKKKKYRLPLDSDETTTGFIKWIFHTMKQTLVENNVRNSFLQIRLQYNIEKSPYLLCFDENVLRQNPGFTSLWQRDYPWEQLLRRRQNTPFGWVNQTMRA
jgi:hypothetical protein